MLLFSSCFFSVGISSLPQRSFDILHLSLTSRQPRARLVVLTLDISIRYDEMQSFRVFKTRHPIFGPCPEAGGTVRCTAGGGQLKLETVLPAAVSVSLMGWLTS